MEHKELWEKQAKAWEEFKTANDARLRAIEEKASTSDVDVKLAKIDGVLQNVAEQQKAIEAKMARSASASVAETDEHKEAFLSFIRKGDTSRIEAVKGMKISDNENGGYLVPDSVVGPIVQRLFDGSPMRQVANVVTIAGNAIQGVVDYGQLEVEWVDEVTSSSDPTTPTLKQYRIPVHNQRSSPRIGPNLLDDAAYNVEMWLSEKIARDFSLSESTAFITGSGSGRPRGITTYSTAATADGSRAWGVFEHVATGTSGGFGTNANGTDKLTDLAYKLKAGYRANAVFMMSKATLGTLRTLKTSGGDYVWSPSVQPGTPATLLGYPVIEAEDMPTIAANSLSVAFGDFRAGYMIVDRMGLSILRDPYSNNPLVTFHAVRRVGGDAVDFDAIKFLKFA
jgi:HK97 family phage major capsid protein